MTLGTIFMFVSISGIYHICNFAFYNIGPTSTSLIESLNQSIESIYEPISIEIGGPLHSLSNIISDISNTIETYTNSVLESANATYCPVGSYWTAVMTVPIVKAYLSEIPYV